jgi:hypothetical protein
MSLIKYIYRSKNVHEFEKTNYLPVIGAAHICEQPSILENQDGGVQPGDD